MTEGRHFLAHISRELKPILAGKAWQQERGASAVRKQSKAGAQVLMVSSFSYLPFMIRSRPPAHGTVPTLFRVRFHFLEMPAPTHDKLCLPG